MNATTRPLLQVQDLNTRFHTLDGVVNAVDGVDFEVYRGETLGLVGESGCGKSVTALSILQLLRCPPGEIQGKILFEGRNLLELDREGIRKIRGNDISMIFQEPMTSLNPVLRVGEQIAEAARLHKDMNRHESWHWAREMLRMVQIPGPGSRSRQYPHKFSGGMRQRAMIAMALSCNPRLILADEPTTALDVSIQAQVINLLARLQEEMKLSYLFIAHDLSVVEHINDRVAVMYLGRIVELATDKALYQNPLHPYSQALLAAVPVPDPEISRKKILLQGDVPSPMNPPTGCTFHTRCPECMDICSQEIPIFKNMGNEHWVACHLR